MTRTLEYSSVPRSVAVRIGGKVRTANKNHCDSCHEDRHYGFPIDESWRFDNEFKDGDKAHDKRGGKPPWALQFCCCYDAQEFDEALQAWISA